MPEAVQRLRAPDTYFLEERPYNFYMALKTTLVLSKLDLTTPKFRYIISVTDISLTDT
jgi:hypothetical protein